jgi:hypothetical protein
MVSAPAHHAIVEAAPEEPGKRGANYRFISLAMRCMSQLFAYASAAVARDRKRRHGHRSHLYFNLI